MKDIFDVLIIGGGPAGMMAGISASTNNKKICLLERNKVLGKKLLLTGNGRCNFTNAKPIPEVIEMFGKQGRFLYGALTKFSNTDLINFFEERGVETKTERGNRVFPASDRAYTILSCLKKELEKNKANIVYDFRVIKISKQKYDFRVLAKDGREIFSKKVIIATGGKTYEKTGSTGDGYWLVKNLGHKILPLKPALAPLFVKDREIRLLAGLSLENVRLTVFSDDQVINSFFGDMIFTHQGISGPIVLKTSKQVYDEIRKNKKIAAIIDLKPALNEKQLKERIYRGINQFPKKEYKSLLNNLLPRLLVLTAIKETKIDSHKKNGSLTKEEIIKIIRFLKDFSFVVDGVAPLDSAIVTAGGVDISEIDSRTMESKIVSRLFFAGEIIALDGPTGGFNLQKAFSTGWLAGKSASI